MPKVTALGWGAEGTNALDPNYLEQQGERWPGKRSEQSFDSPETSLGKRQLESPKPARTTGRRSKKDRTGNSTAGSTAGSTPSDVLPPHPKGPVDAQ